MKKLLILLAVASFATGAQGQKVSIFDNTPVNAAGSFADMKADDHAVIHTAGGRLILKKVTFPTFKNTTKATINMTVASAGDRWDKSGSCFLIPIDAANNFWEVLANGKKFPGPTATSGDMNGHIAIGDYEPAVELLRFMTPFGVGHFSDDQLKRKPVYIPHWAENVSWSQDISQLISVLQGEAIVGVWIDSWTPEGYVVSTDVTFEQSRLSCDKIVKSEVVPLTNTVYYTGAMGSPTMFATGDVTVDFALPVGAKNARLYYITTGHGGHSGGDEFVKKQNLVTVDGKTVIDFIPWRDDCASFRRFNPGSGVWIRQRMAPYIGRSGQYEEKMIEESLASSDLSRSGWCPGSCIVPESVALPGVGAGSHSVTISIPDAQKADGDKFNHWLVSAYIVFDK